MSDQWNLGANVERLLSFRAVRQGERFHRPKELAAALAIESGELQELFLWRDPEAATVVREDQERMERVRKEVAEITIFLLLLSNDLQIDLARAVQDKIADGERRYDVERHRYVALKATD